jgi:hypothetical protein
VTCCVVIKHRPQVTACIYQTSAGPESLRHQRVAQAGTVSGKSREYCLPRCLADLQNKDVVAGPSGHVVGSDSTIQSIIAAQTEVVRALFDKTGALGIESEYSIIFVSKAAGQGWRRPAQVPALKRED